MDQNVSGSSHLVELPQVLLLCLVDHSQDSGDGFANDTAVRTSTARVRKLSDVDIVNHSFELGV